MWVGLDKGVEQVGFDKSVVPSYAVLWGCLRVGKCPVSSYLYMFDLLITEAGLANITVSKACVARRAVLLKKFGSLQGQAYHESMAR